MMRNMAGMMKKVQEMQSRMEALQQEMANTEFSAAIGSGAVQVTVTGKGEMRAVKIDPSAVDAEDIGMLEDMICLAANNARAEADAAMAAKAKRFLQARARDQACLTKHEVSPNTLSVAWQRTKNNKVLKIFSPQALRLFEKKMQ